LKDRVKEPIAPLALRPSPHSFHNRKPLVTRNNFLNHFLIFFTLNGTRRIDQPAAWSHHLRRSPQNLFLLLSELHDIDRCQTPANLRIATQRARAGTRRINEDFALIGDYFNQCSQEEGHSNINALEFSAMYRCSEHCTIGPGIQIGLGNGEETPNLGAGVRLKFGF